MRDDCTTTSRGLCELICPPRTNERGGKGYCVRGGGGEGGVRVGRGHVLRETPRPVWTSVEVSVYSAFITAVPIIKLFAWGVGVFITTAITKSKFFYKVNFLCFLDKGE